MWSIIKEPEVITGQQEVPSVAFRLAQADQKVQTLLDSVLALLIIESVRDHPTFSRRIPGARCQSIPDRRKRNSSFVRNLTH
jgi:hypothetical protein